MNRSKFAALAAATCLAVGAAGALAGTAPLASADGGAPAPGPLAPFSDDTGTFSVSLPSNWTIETAPSDYWGFWEVVPTGVDYPTIKASPPTAPNDMDTIGSTVVVQAIPLSDTGDVLESIYGDFGVDCDAANFHENPFTLNGGMLIGRSWDWYGCYSYGRHTVIADYGTTYTLLFDFFAETQADYSLADAIVNSITPSGRPLPTPTPVTTPPTVTFPWADFRAVPKLGPEGSRGTGCGSSGQVGDVIPDGWWSGFAWTTDGAWMNVNLVCVFAGSAAQQALADRDDNILDADPNFLVIDNNDRVRTMPINTASFTVQAGQPTGTGCAPGAAIAAPGQPTTMAWVHIAGGKVDYALYDCARTLNPLPPLTPAPSNLPPAYPTAGGFDVWPYGEFWNVPQLGSEPVRGSGCGANGEIGDTIPDGLWAGYVSLDPSTDLLWIDLLCIYYGDSAQQVLADGGASIVLNDPGYLIVNNNDRRRSVPNNLQTILSSAADPSGRCVPYGSSGPAPGAGHITAPVYEITDYAANQAWIRIADGAVTWMIYGCDTGFQPGG